MLSYIHRIIEWSKLSSHVAVLFVWMMVFKAWSSLMSKI